MKVAYLVNQYPHVSHSFIRREIVALEAEGLVVERFSVRPPPADLVDPADVAELAKTRQLLRAGAAKLLLALLGTALRSPGAWWQALRGALRLGARSDRGRRAGHRRRRRLRSALRPLKRPGALPPALPP